MEEILTTKTLKFKKKLKILDLVKEMGLNKISIISNLNVN